MASQDSNRTRKQPATRKKSAPRKKSARQQAEEQRRDIQALVLIAVGILLALGLYTQATGVVGRSLADLSGYLVGVVRYLLPLLLIGFGAYMLINRPSPRSRRRKKRRTVSGVELVSYALAGFAAFSFLDFFGGRPHRFSGVDELSQAGGMIGVLTGGTLDRYTGSFGQVILTLLMAAVAAILITDVSVGEVVRSWVDRFSGVSVGGTKSRSRSRGRSGAKQSDLASRFRKLVDRDEDTEFEDDDIPDLDDDNTEVVLDEPAEHYIDLKNSDVDDDDEPGDRWEDEIEPVIEVPEVAVVSDIHMAAPQPPDGEWSLPSLDLLDRTETQDVDRASVEATGRQLEHALAEHGVETRLIGVVVGPTVSRFELELGPGVKVQRVTSLHKDIAYAMATPDVRILAPIPGKQAIGVEVPNVRRQIITVGDLLISEEAVSATHPLEVTLGRDITGKTVMINLAKMPHLLVAGQTGSGKSSCINSMLTSILMRSTPDQVRLILIDPKRVELTQYEKLPHLLTEVVTDPKKAANALSWAVTEMERRYDLLSEVGVRDMAGYNKAVDEGRLDPSVSHDGQTVEREKLSFIVIVLDELADLMMVAARDVEESICRIAQKARAVGIHLVIATQRPSTNVITGLIKANVPARLAFAVSSLTDSRVILDQPGAERLVGRGDGLINDGTTSTPVRFQGAWVTEDEVSTISEHWREQSPEVAYDSRVVGEDKPLPGVGIPGGTTGDEGDDELLVQAMELVVRSQLGSTSMLQRKLRVGFARAGRIMDLLEERGVVGPSVGSKPREVLISADELDAGVWAAPAAPAVPVKTAPPATRKSSSQPVVPKPKVRRKTLADIPNPEPMVDRPKRRRPAAEHNPSEESGPLDRQLREVKERRASLKAVKDEADDEIVEQQHKNPFIDDDVSLDVAEDDFEDLFDEDDDDDFDEDFEDGSDSALAPPPGYNNR